MANSTTPVRHDRVTANGTWLEDLPDDQAVENGAVICVFPTTDPRQRTNEATDE